MSDNLERALEHYFGYPSFREAQKPLVEAIYRGEPCLGILPTSGGKSICFQLPALLGSSLTVVVSPLLSLISDQVNTLKSLNIPAESIVGITDLASRQRIYKQIQSKQLKLLYVAPETFYQKSFISQLTRHTHIERVVFDEAHCLSQWGEDFRPGYLHAVETLNLIKQAYSGMNLPQPMVSALTASATPTIQKHLCELLEIPAENIYRSTLVRPNLRYRIEPLDKRKKRDAALLNLAAQYSAVPVIVYANSRAKTERIARSLKIVNVNAEYYHAGMTSQERARVQNDFISGNANIIVATTAFGMGVDKSDVRAVIHYDIPRTVEDYYQQAGRAGRDGAPADCVLLYDEVADYSLINRMFEYSQPTSKDVAQVYEVLWAMQSDMPGQPFSFSVGTLAKAMDITEPRLQWSLNYLERQHILTKMERDYYVREISDANWSAIDAIRSFRLEKAFKMLSYGKTNGCRQQFIAEYFGELSSTPCGVCDNCRNGRVVGGANQAFVESQQLKQKIESALKQMSKVMGLPVIAIATPSQVDSLAKHPPESVDEITRRIKLNSGGMKLSGAPLISVFQRAGHIQAGTEKSVGTQSKAVCEVSLAVDDSLPDW